MKKLILTSAVSAFALLVAACGDGADDAETAEDTAAMESDAMADTAGATTASADWPRGTRIVEEGGATYRVNSDGTRVVISDGARIVTEGEERFRVDRAGTRVRIDERGVDLDLDGPDIEGVDVDLGTNRRGNLDLDVSTDGTDASPDDR